MKILLAQADGSLADFLQRALTSHGHEADVTSRFWDISEHCVSYNYDMVLLDIVLLCHDGDLFSLPAALERTGTLLVVLTPLSKDVGGWVAKAMGAHDYISMPFAMSFLLTQLKYVLTKYSDTTKRLGVGDLTLDPVGRSAWRGSLRISVDSTEFSLLKLLAERAGYRVNHLSLAKHVFGDTITGRAGEVKTVVERLCSKVNRGATLIHKVPGGYRLGNKGDRLMESRLRDLSPRNQHLA